MTAYTQSHIDTHGQTYNIPTTHIHQWVSGDGQVPVWYTRSRSTTGSGPHSTRRVPHTLHSALIRYYLDRTKYTNKCTTAVCIEQRESSSVVLRQDSGRLRVQTEVRTITCLENKRRCIAISLYCDCKDGMVTIVL